MKGQRLKMGILGGIAAFLITAVAGCSALTGGNRVDCNVVKLQSEAGRSSAEIASALSVSEADVDSCHPSGPANYDTGGGGGAGDQTAPSGDQTAPPSEAPPAQ